MDARKTRGVILPPIEYPDSDGEPMADNDANRERMIDGASSLRKAMRARRVTAYVSGDLFVYPVEGEPWTRNAPDLLVAPACEQYRRPSFKYWEEPGTVDFAGEFLSFVAQETLESHSIGLKVHFYRTKLGTRELFLYEPLGDDFDAGFRFRFLRLDAGGDYEEVGAQANGWFMSEVLGLELRPTDEQVEFRDPRTRTLYLPNRLRADEESRRADEESRRADQEAEARRRAEERIRELERKLQQRGTPPDGQ